MSNADNTEQAAAQTLVGISFNDVFRAREFMTAVTGMGAREELTLRDVVLVEKNADGRTNVTETTDPQGKQSALSGAVWAGLFGLILGGPVGWAAGIAVGAGAGAVAAKVIDLGVSDEWIAWFRAAVRPGTATVVVLITDYNADALVREAKRFTGSHLVYANVDDDLMDRLRIALGEPAAASPSTDARRRQPPDDPAPDPRSPMPRPSTDHRRPRPSMHHPPRAHRDRTGRAGGHEPHAAGPMSTLVHLEVDRAIATITLDSPDNRNALSAALVDQLAATPRNRDRRPRRARHRAHGHRFGLLCRRRSQEPARQRSRGWRHPARRPHGDPRPAPRWSSPD